MSFGFGLDTARQLGFHFHRFAVGIGHEEYGGHPIRCFRLESLYLALAFYDKAEQACYIVQSGETSQYANIILQKGVVKRNK